MFGLLGFIGCTIIFSTRLFAGLFTGLFATLLRANQTIDNTSDLIAGSKAGHSDTYEEK
jgi:hypothetical protein